MASYQYTSWDLIKRFVARNRALTAVVLIALLCLGVSEFYAWSLVRARDASLKDARVLFGASLMDQAHGAVGLRDWNRAVAAYEVAAEAGTPGAKVAVAAFAPWSSPLRKRGGLVPVPANGAGAFDVESGFALLGAPGRGVFSIDDDKNWKLVEGTTDPERRVLPAAIAPGGKWWALKSAALRLSTSEGSMHALPGTERAAAVAFSFDGAVLAVASPGVVQLFDAPSGTPGRVVTPAPEVPVVIAVSRNGKAIAVAGADGSLRWWGLDGVLHERAAGGAEVTALLFSADAQRLFVADTASQVHLFEVATAVQVHSFSGHSQAVRALALSPRGGWLATASGDGAVLLWDLGTAKLLSRLEGDGDELRAVSFSADGELLGALDRTGRRYEWKVSGLAAHLPIASLKEGPVWAVAEGSGSTLWARTPQALMLLGGDGELHWREAAKGNDVLAVEEGLLVGKSGQIDLYAADNGAVTESANPCRATVWTFARSPDGATIWIGCGSAVLGLDAETLEAGGSPIHAKTAVRKLAVSSTGDRLAWISEDGAGALVRLPALMEEEAWSGRQSQAVAFDASGKWLVTAGEDGVVLRHGQSGVELKRLSSRDLRVRQLGFAFGGAAVWAAGAAGLSMWSVEGGAQLELPGLYGEVTAASPTLTGDGLWLADATGQIFLHRF